MPQDHQRTRTSGLCRGTNAPEVPKSANPIGVTFCILVCVCIAAYALWPSKPKQPEALKESQVTELRKILQSVEARDKIIAEREKGIDRLESRANGTPDEIRNYYHLLSELHWARKERADYANNYNGTARNLFNHDKIPPIELRKIGLPTGIR